jgi:hypothetical protein
VANCFVEEQWQKDTHHNMRSAREDAARGMPPSGFASIHAHPNRLLNVVLETLDAAKAEDVATIDLRGKTSIGDQMVIASGRSQRHVGAVADHLMRKLVVGGPAHGAAGDLIEDRRAGQAEGERRCGS